MSHQEKICETALTSHIETCHEQCSFTPLIVKRDWLAGATPASQGLVAKVEAELDERTEKHTQELKASVEEGKHVFLKLSEDRRASGKDSIDWRRVIAQTKPSFEAALDSEMEKAQAQIRRNTIEESKGWFDTSNPERAIALREEALAEKFDALAGETQEIKPGPWITFREIPQLGLLFSESLCYRSEGLTYQPCGEEFSILPGESISQSNVLTTTRSDESSSSYTTEESLTTKDQREDTQSFTSSYERTRRREIDIKRTTEASFKIPFKLFSLGLKATSSFSFSNYLSEVNKVSHSATKRRFHEIAYDYTRRATVSQSSSLTEKSVLGFKRQWKNKSDHPLTYIRRQSWCKMSVIHKRHNVHLGWSGCIEKPARDLCTPQNIEQKYAEEIKAIRDKWDQAPAPANFGPRPANEKRCTGNHNYSSSLGKKKHVPIHDTIPAGWYYIGQPQLEFVSSTTTPQTYYISSQPAHGATGGILFDTYVDVKDRALLLHTEKAVVRVCYLIAPEAAKDWDDRLEVWRDTQAQKEINAFLASKQEELEEFLGSEQAHAAIIRRIMEDYFNVNPASDCCKLIARLHRLFDFSRLCFSLLPLWNQNAHGCQQSQAVNLYNAICLHFYLPIQEGQELEALQLLASIGAIPWSHGLSTQYLAYIAHIDHLRQTVYHRAFDPDGWDQKFDQPKGYKLTAHSTSNPQQWDAEHETELNYEVLGAFTIEVPCAGERIDPRPALCKE